MKLTRNILLLSALLSLNLAATADEVPLWSGIDDIVVYTPKAMTDAVLLRTAEQKDARLTAGGAKFRYAMDLSAAAVMPNNDVMYSSYAMMTDGQGQTIFRKFNLEVGGTPRQLVSVQIVQDIPLSSMHFTISVGLIDRLMFVNDATDGISLTFPLGVGGLDENVVGIGRRILTPQFHGAWIDRSTVISHLDNPTYYRNEPYLPITNNKGQLMPVAFHITILSDDDWTKRGPNYLVRGFESHACMRMRIKDLHQLYAIVMTGADSIVPVNVDYFLMNPDGSGLLKEINPYPVEENAYMRVTNFAGPGQKPVSKRDDKEHLLIMDHAEKAPDLIDLRDFTADDKTDTKIFDGLELDYDKLRSGKGGK